MTTPTDDTWIVVADAGRARFFRTDAEISFFDEFEDMVSPTARLRTHELVSDHQGASDRHGGMSSDLGNKDAPHQKEEARSAKALADRIDDAVRQNRFRDLVLVASPIYLGLLRKELGAAATGRVSASIHKDYTHLPPRDVRELVGKHLREKPLPR